MSTLSVSYITTPSNTTPLVLSSSNSQAAFVRIEAANNDIVFNGFTKFIGGFSTSSINTAFDTTNTAYASINSNWTVTNTVYGVANAAYGAANNVSPQIAPSYNTANSAYNQDNVVFGVANASYNFSNSAYASINSNWTVTNTVYGVANAAFGKANSSFQNTTGTLAGSLTVLGQSQLTTGGQGKTVISHYDGLTRITAANTTTGGGTVAVGREPVAVHGMPAGQYTVELWSGANGGTQTLLATGGNIQLPSGVTIQNNSGRPILNQSGSILQVVQTVLTSTASYAPNGTEQQVTGLATSITPSSSSSKILILLNINYSSGGTTYGGYFKRSGTQIGIGDAGGSQQRVGLGMALATDANQINSFFYQYLDSPATTSSTAYTFWLNNDNTGTCFINRSQNDGSNNTGKRCISTVTLIEIAQ